MTKLISKKWKNSLLAKKKSLVGSTPGVNFTNILQGAQAKLALTFEGL